MGGNESKYRLISLSCGKTGFSSKLLKYGIRCCVTAKLGPRARFFFFKFSLLLLSIDWAMLSCYQGGNSFKKNQGPFVLFQIKTGIRFLGSCGPDSFVCSKDIFLHPIGMSTPRWDICIPAVDLQNDAVLLPRFLILHLAGFCWTTKRFVF